MAVDLAELVDPAHTAVLTMELQRGVVGDRAAIPDLRAEVERRGVVAQTARVVEAARAAGAHVVHCVAEFRADRAGSSDNAPLLRALARGEPNLIVGSDSTELVPALGPAPGDLVAGRRHGLTPFPGTDLDQTLRNLGVGTVVATGVSVNIGITGLVMVAVDLGYRCAVVTDAVAGVPTEYADAVLRHTLAPLATLVSADEVCAVWTGT
ncbi:MAG TPA: isochorismatase family protein [Acidimicrobiia bacterium]|nr:isochorismatase family protein [Acidimicrobiia bacterium]